MRLFTRNELYTCIINPGNSIVYPSFFVFLSFSLTKEVKYELHTIILLRYKIYFSKKQGGSVSPGPRPSAAQARSIMCRFFPG